MLWKRWNEIWFNMADFDITQYEVLKGMPELEFYTLFKLHEDKIKKLNARNKANANARSK